MRVGTGTTSKKEAMTVLVNVALFSAGLLESAVCAGLLARLAGTWVVTLVRGRRSPELGPPAEP